MNTENKSSEEIYPKSERPSSLILNDYIFKSDVESRLIILSHQALESAEARIKELESELETYRSLVNDATEEIKRKDQLIRLAWEEGIDQNFF